MVVRGNHDPRHALFPRSGAVYATSPRAVQLEARGRPTPNPNPNPNPNPTLDHHLERVRLRGQPRVEARLLRGDNQLN